MEKSARRLHQKAHTCIEWIEIRIRAWQIHNKPLFYIFAGICWLFTTLAAGSLLDIVLPKLEKGWVVSGILCLIGAFIFLAIFILAAGQKRKRGFLFWYPWSMVFILVAGILFLQVRQNYTEKKFSRILADTNSFFTTSNSYSVWVIQRQTEQFANLQKQFDEYKRDSLAEKLDLKSDVNEANRAKDVAKEELTFWEANPDKLNQAYSNIFSRLPTSFEQVDSMFARFNGAISNLNQIETETKKLQDNANQIPYSSNRLADLGIERLPDGRTKVGGMVTGKPTVVIDAFTEGFQVYTNQDFSNAFAIFRRGIDALEATRLAGIVMSMGGDITPEGKGALYALTADCAMRIHSNSLAIDYAQKSVAASPNIENKILLTYAFGNSGLQKFRADDLAGAFPFFQMAISNFETIANFDVTTNSNIKSEMIKIYTQGAIVASVVRNTNQASEWRRKIAALMK
jgi:hypothetical protein